MQQIIKDYFNIPKRETCSRRNFQHSRLSLATDACNLGDTNSQFQIISIAQIFLTCIYKQQLTFPDICVL